MRGLVDDSRSDDANPTARHVFAAVSAASPHAASPHVTAGVGLRYKTPVGPLRLDYGYKLNPDEEGSPGRLYFSIGFPL